MIDIKYQDHWNHILNSQIGHSLNRLDIAAERFNPSVLLPFMNASNAASNNFKDFSAILKNIIEIIFSSYDEEDCLYGFFSALSKTKHQITPFLATHNYCIKILSYSLNNTLSLNISPIYYLGPEYPHEYKLKHGTDLDAKAIIGLIELPCGMTNEMTHHHHFPENNEYKTYRLGIDAGIVFRDSAIAHNKHMTLHLNQTNNGIMADLLCETQATSKKFTWQQLGLQELSKSSANNQLQKKFNVMIESTSA